MNLAVIKHQLGRHITNIPGWRTNRKIVVIESDDWGSIRMPSKKVYEKLLRAGIRVDRCPYNRYDSLASEEDLYALFEVLTKFCDKKGNHPVITANTVVANPDFEKIKASGFKEYFYEPFNKTLKRYPFHKNAFNLWKEGISNNIFFPQFHGREHINIPLWLKLLQENNEVFRKAFHLGFWGIGPEIIRSGKIHIQASYDSDDEKNLKIQEQAIREGLILFKNLFGYKSKSFIANNFIWDKRLNKVLSKQGVEYIQGMKYQILPIYNAKKRKLIFHYTGEKNNLDQIFLVRNCNFEPTENPEQDSVSNCISQIKSSFFWKKPAIISTHRLNFIGSIEKHNRTRNLKLLEKLLKKLLIKWPDLEFKTSKDLGDIIANKADSINIS